MKMKTKSSLLFALLIMVATYTQAQSKKEIEAKFASCTTAKDSIQNVLTIVSAKNDSLYMSNEGYNTMYIAIKEKLLKQDFDPKNMSALIDSLKTNSSLGIAVLNDSISSLHLENNKLKETITASMDVEVDKTEVVYELKQLKELLDEKILTQEEFDLKKTILLEKL